MVTEKNFAMAFKESILRDMVFGLLDLSVAMFFFVPFFGQKADDYVQAVSLLLLTGIAPYLKAAYYTGVSATITLGLATFVLHTNSMATILLSSAVLHLVH